MLLKIGVVPARLREAARVLTVGVTTDEEDVPPALSADCGVSSIRDHSPLVERPVTRLARRAGATAGPSVSASRSFARLNPGYST
jgi:hypothetical protein